MRKNTCIHHWVLTEPNEREVRGTCRRCGARRTYPVVVEVPDAAPEDEVVPASVVAAMEEQLAEQDEPALSLP
jgi:hypothetical protein